MSEREAFLGDAALRASFLNPWILYLLGTPTLLAETQAPSASEASKLFGGSSSDRGSSVDLQAIQ